VKIFNQKIARYLPFILL